LQELIDWSVGVEEEDLPRGDLGDEQAWPPAL
jgi:hypothetical protein